MACRCSIVAASAGNSIDLFLCKPSIERGTNRYESIELLLYLASFFLCFIFALKSILLLYYSNNCLLKIISFTITTVKKGKRMWANVVIKLTRNLHTSSRQKSCFFFLWKYDVNNRWMQHSADAMNGKIEVISRRQLWRSLFIRNLIAHIVNLCNCIFYRCLQLIECERDGARVNWRFLRPIHR